MNTTLTKFLVVSLPRTGTMSMSQMCKDLGFNVNHVPGPDWKAFLGRQDVLADTPVYSVSIVEEVLNDMPEVGFIYIEKDPVAWVESMFKVGLQNAYHDMRGQVQRGEELTRHAQADYDAFMELFKGEDFTESQGVTAFNEHRNTVLSMIPSERLLTYSFDQGWDRLCDFVGREAPETPVPHLNQNTMFDQLK